MTSPVLTICIPTYNRCQKIIGLLDRIKTELEFLNEEVHVIISENPSNDANRNKLKNYHKDNNFFNLIIQKNNIGFIRNYYFLISKAKSDYVWVIGDDDYISEGSLKHILKLIKNNPSSPLFMLRREGYNLDYENIVHNKFNYKNKWGFHTDPKEFLIKYNKESYNNFLLSDLMFISVNVMKISLIKDIFEERYKMLKSSNDDNLYICDPLYFSLNLISGGFYIDDFISVFSNKTTDEQVSWHNTRFFISSYLIPKIIIDQNNVIYSQKFKRKLLSVYFKRSVHFFRLFKHVSPKKRKSILKFLSRLTILSIFINRIVNLPLLFIKKSFRYIFSISSGRR